MNGLHLELDYGTQLDPNNGLARAYRGRTVDADYNGRTDQCGRCNRQVGAHQWRVVDTSDPDLADQEGVLDCGIVGEWK